MQDTGGFWFRDRFNGRHSIVRWTEGPAVSRANSNAGTCSTTSDLEPASEVHLVGGASLQIQVRRVHRALRVQRDHRAGSDAGGYDQFDQRDQYDGRLNVNDKDRLAGETFTPVLFGGTAGKTGSRSRAARATQPA